jgi:hypothetical protein
MNIKKIETVDGTKYQFYTTGVMIDPITEEEIEYNQVEEEITKEGLESRKQDVVMKLQLIDELN